MRAEVLSWCRREALFSPGAQVVCAVSGGADSMAMLCCLRELAAELSVYVRAAHFNHRLRGAESDGDEAFVRAFCAAEGIELVCGAPEKPARSEEEAREQRYAFLDSIPCDAVAIAHTAEDNLETLLQHLLRGSGLRGLGGIPPRRGRYVRPLLAVSHAQARDYLRARGTGWREDATNAEDGCQRNRLRHGVLPLLAAETPELPLRVTHNDTKLNNVLFDRRTRKALCVLDLDTVMPGSSLYDYGDSIRFGAATAAEDEKDLSKMGINLHLFQVYTAGYLAACKSLTPKELELLPLGAKIITLELAVRFLTDYLDGDRYFRVAYPEHNLVRARAQMKLVADMEAHWDEMQAIVAEEAAKRN